MIIGVLKSGLLQMVTAKSAIGGFKRLTVLIMTVITVQKTVDGLQLVSKTETEGFLVGNLALGGVDISITGI